MPDLRKARKAETRQRVLQAARTLLRTRNLEDVGIREIAAEAGVATGTVIGAFGSKSDLIHEIVVEDLQMQAILVRAAMDGLEQVADRLHAATRVLLAHALSQPGLSRVRGIDSWTRRPEHEEAVSQARADVAAPLREALFPGTPDNDHPAVEAALDTVTAATRIGLHRGARAAEEVRAAHTGLILRALAPTLERAAA